MLELFAHPVIQLLLVVDIILALCAVGAGILFWRSTR